MGLECVLQSYFWVKSVSKTLLRHDFEKFFERITQAKNDERSEKDQLPH